MGELLQVYRLSIGARGVLHDADGYELHVSLLPFDSLMLIRSIRRRCNLRRRYLCQLSDNRRQPGVDRHADRYRYVDTHIHTDLNGYPYVNTNGDADLNSHPDGDANRHSHTDADVYSNVHSYTNSQAGEWHVLLDWNPVRLGFLRRRGLLRLALVPGRAGLH
jgi:hypothetical protein